MSNKYILNHHNNNDNLNYNIDEVISIIIIFFTLHFRFIILCFFSKQQEKKIYSMKNIIKELGENKRVISNNIDNIHQ